MIRIPCPYCGPRDHEEFAYMGDAGRRRPPIGLDANDRTPWFEYVYLRENPRGPHLEYWQHVHGCRAIVKVLRDTATHEVLAAGLPADDLKPDGADGG
ncbi:MAG TPA: sarcosine oxidase subunit delta [Alphaproteobacteria bacterium]|nr:sarcosine oxidase subunit delta [Alphaproteobacteria bacterium]